MKIFHTADWHIGKLLHKENLIEEQREVLFKFLDDIDEKKPDAVIVAGDIYDTAIPRIEAIDLLDEIINEIISRDVKLIMISGNHDSSDRLSFGSRMFRDNGLFMVTDCENIENPIVLEDEFGKVNIYPYPFMTVAKGRHQFENSDISSFNSLADTLIGESKEIMDLNERNIAVYHGFIIKSDNQEKNENEVTYDLSVSDSESEDKNRAVESDSERPLSIGGTDFINSDIFSDFDYTALGHLHGPQRAGNDNIRYSGSLMKYSFSEENQKKGYYEIDLKEKGNMDIKFNEIYPARDIRILEGTFDELKAGEPSDDYIMIRLHVDDAVYEPKARLSEVYPNILHMEIIKKKTAERKLNLNIREKLKKKDIMGLFEDFYEDASEKKFTDDKREIMKRIAEKIESESGSDRE